MTERPYTLLSCAVSLDGYIDDATATRLLLSNDADFDRVDEVRASCDAILVGANTVRNDNPRLLVRSPARQQARIGRGAAPHPAKVTITRNGDLDPAAKFFTAGESTKLVYAASSAWEKTHARVGAIATVVDAGEPIDLGRILPDLAGRGIARLMVEGGGATHTAFLAAGFGDELHLVIAPFFVADSRAPRFTYDGSFPWDSGNRARLVEVRQIEEVVLLRYALSSRCGPGDPP